MKPWQRVIKDVDVDEEDRLFLGTQLHVDFPSEQAVKDYKL